MPSFNRRRLLQSLAWSALGAGLPACERSSYDPEYLEDTPEFTQQRAPHYFVFYFLIRRVRSFSSFCWFSVFFSAFLSYYFWAFVFFVTLALWSLVDGVGYKQGKGELAPCLEWLLVGPWPMLSMHGLSLSLSQV